METFGPAVLAFFGAIFGAYASIRSTNKTILNSAVTKERAKWREFLRMEMGEFTKTVILLLQTNYSESRTLDPYQNCLASLEKWKVRILLRLNPNPDQILETEILRLIETIACALRRRPVDSFHVYEVMQKLQRCVQCLLKADWDKSVSEAIKGKVSPHDYLYLTNKSGEEICTPSNSTHGHANHSRKGLVDRFCKNISDNIDILRNLIKGY